MASPKSTKSDTTIPVLSVLNNLFGEEARSSINTPRNKTRTPGTGLQAKIEIQRCNTDSIPQAPMKRHELSPRTRVSVGIALDFDNDTETRKGRQHDFDDELEQRTSKSCVPITPVRPVTMVVMTNKSENCNNELIQMSPYHNTNKENIHNGASSKMPLIYGSNVSIDSPDPCSKYFEGHNKNSIRRDKSRNVHFGQSQDCAMTPNFHHTSSENINFKTPGCVNEDENEFASAAATPLSCAETPLATYNNYNQQPNFQAPNRKKGARGNTTRSSGEDTCEMLMMMEDIPDYNDEEEDEDEKCYSSGGAHYQTPIASNNNNNDRDNISQLDQSCIPDPDFDEQQVMNESMGCLGADNTFTRLAQGSRGAVGAMPMPATCTMAMPLIGGSHVTMESPDPRSKYNSNNASNNNNSNHINKNNYNIAVGSRGSAPSDKPAANNKTSKNLLDLLPPKLRNHDGATANNHSNNTNCNNYSSTAAMFPSTGNSMRAPQNTIKSGGNAQLNGSQTPSCPVPLIYGSNVTVDSPDPISRYNNNNNNNNSNNNINIINKCSTQDEFDDFKGDGGSDRVVYNGSTTCSIPLIGGSNVTLDSPDPCSKYNGNNSNNNGQLPAHKQASRQAVATGSKTSHSVKSSIPLIGGSNVTMDSPDPCSRYNSNNNSNINNIHDCGKHAVSAEQDQRTSCRCEISGEDNEPHTQTRRQLVGHGSSGEDDSHGYDVGMNASCTAALAVHECPQLGLPGITGSSSSVSLSSTSSTCSSTTATVTVTGSDHIFPSAGGLKSSHSSRHSHSNIISNSNSSGSNNTSLTNSSRSLKLQVVPPLQLISEAKNFLKTQSQSSSSSSSSSAALHSGSERAAGAGAGDDFSASAHNKDDSDHDLTTCSSASIRSRSRQSSRADTFNNNNNNSDAGMSDVELQKKKMPTRRPVLSGGAALNQQSSKNALTNKLHISLLTPGPGALSGTMNKPSTAQFGQGIDPFMTSPDTITAIADYLYHDAKLTKDCSDLEDPSADKVKIVDHILSSSGGLQALAVAAAAAAAAAAATAAAAAAAMPPTGIIERDAQMAVAGVSAVTVTMKEPAAGRQQPSYRRRQYVSPPSGTSSSSSSSSNCSAPSFTSSNSSSSASSSSQYQHRCSQSAALLSSPVQPRDITQHISAEHHNQQQQQEGDDDDCHPAMYVIPTSDMQLPVSRTPSKRQQTQQQSSNEINNDNGTGKVSGIEAAVKTNMTANGHVTPRTVLWTKPSSLTSSSISSSSSSSSTSLSSSSSAAGNVVATCAVDSLLCTSSSISTSPCVGSPSNWENNSNTANTLNCNINHKHDYAHDHDYDPRPNTHQYLSTQQQQVQSTCVWTEACRSEAPVATMSAVVMAPMLSRPPSSQGGPSGPSTGYVRPNHRRIVATAGQ